MNIQETDIRGQKFNLVESLKSSIAFIYLILVADTRVVDNWSKAVLPTQSTCSVRWLLQKCIYATFAYSKQSKNSIAAAKECRNFQRVFVRKKRKSTPVVGLIYPRKKSVGFDRKKKKNKSLSIVWYFQTNRKRLMSVSALRLNVLEGGTFGVLKIFQEIWNFGVFPRTCCMKTEFSLFFVKNKVH